jgi:hypothetical protein
MSEEIQPDNLGSSSGSDEDQHILVKPGRREGDTISFVFFSFQIVVALFSLKI